MWLVQPALEFDCLNPKQAVPLLDLHGKLPNSNSCLTRCSEGLGAWEFEQPLKRLGNQLGGQSTWKCSSALFCHNDITSHRWLHAYMHQRGSLPSYQHQSLAGELKQLTSHYNSSTSKSTPPTTINKSWGCQVYNIQHSWLIKPNRKPLEIKCHYNTAFLDIYYGVPGSVMCIL